jgi:hypothetical protein
VFGVGISGADSRAIIARGCGRGSKAYLPNFSRSLQTELPNNKIVIQAVLLGFVRIEFFDVAGSASSFLEHLFVSAGEPADAARWSRWTRANSSAFQPLRDTTTCTVFEDARREAVSVTERPAPRYGAERDERPLSPISSNSAQTETTPNLA